MIQDGKTSERADMIGRPILNGDYVIVAYYHPTRAARIVSFEDTAAIVSVHLTGTYTYCPYSALVVVEPELLEREGVDLDDEVAKLKFLHGK